MLGRGVGRVGPAGGVLSRACGFLVEVLETPLPAKTGLN